MDRTPSPPSSATGKLRLMCSYGGHIVPRPHDKALCYAGGETRIVAVDRRTAASLPPLTAHLSKSLLDGRPFGLKYQLPNHDLDSLISVASDEDLANMLEDYDRLSLSSPPSRLRFFLSPIAAGDGLSDDWFFDALRNVGVGPPSHKAAADDCGASLPDSIPLEKDSSFGSTGSSASNSTSPAVRSADDALVGLKLPDFRVSLPLADSLGSDTSLPSPNFSPHAIVFQDASAYVESKVVSANLVETESNASDRSPRSERLTHVPVSGYVLSKPMDQLQHPTAPPPPPPLPQPQYIYPPTQTPYVTQYYTSAVPVSSYPTMYQPYVPTQQPLQYPINKPCPVYMMPVGQAQNPYDRSLQSTLVSAQSIAPTHSQVSSHPVMFASPMGYEGYKPSAPAPDYTPKVYRTTAVASTHPLSMPSDDHQHHHQHQHQHHHQHSPPPAPQVVGFPAVGSTQPLSMPSDDHQHQHQHPPPQIVGLPAVKQTLQPIAAAPLENAKFLGDYEEYEDPMHAQIYKTQPSGPTLPSQLQVAANAATVTLSETFAQLHVENTKQ